MPGLELQRKNMVESQVRPSDVTDRRITSAMMALPRERFVPANVANLAYMDEAIAVGPGRGLMAPRVLARLVQLADVSQNDSVLVVGAGSGYSAALLASLGQKVIALESDTDMAARIAPLLGDLGIANVAAVPGPLPAGWQPAAPYDVILLDGAVDAVPEALTAQLAAGGRLVAIEKQGGFSRAVLLRKSGEVVSRRVAFDAAAPALPGFERAAGFVF